MGTGIQHKSRTVGDVVNSTEVWAEEHEVTGHILPGAPNVYDLGSTGFPFRRLYLSAGGLGESGIVESGDLASDAIDAYHAAIDHLASMLKPAIQPYNTNITFSVYGTLGGSPDSHDSVQWTSGTVAFADGTTQSIDAGNDSGLATGIHYIYFTDGSATLTVTNAYDQTSSDTKSLLAVLGVSSDTDQEISIQTLSSKGQNINADLIATNAIITAHVLANQITAGKISVVGLDGDGKLVLSQIGSGNLDNIGNGSTYGRLRLTQIDGGNIKLTSSSSASGEWYDYSGVEIDSSHGINIYGTANALTTRATKAGTIQCKVDAAGKMVAGAGNVELDASGLTIKGQFLFFEAGGVTRGMVNASGTALWVQSPTGNLYLDANGTIYLYDPANTRGLQPNADSTYDIGTDVNRYANGYFDDLYGTLHDLELADMVCPLCDKGFEKADSLTMYVKRVEKEKIVTVPAHLGCSLKEIN